jgi:hypothetical protein
MNLEEWEIKNNNSNVEISYVKNKVNELQWEFVNTSFFTNVFLSSRLRNKISVRVSLLLHT